MAKKHFSEKEVENLGAGGEEREKGRWSFENKQERFMKW